MRSTRQLHGLQFQYVGEMPDAKRRLVVDSRFRMDGEEPDDYTVEFMKPLQNLKTISLVASNVTFSSLSIDRGNDTITVARAGGVTATTLPHGNLADVAAVVSMLQSNLGPSILVDSDENDRLVFTSTDEAFTVQASGSLARVLGLRPALPTGIALSHRRAPRASLQSEEESVDNGDGTTSSLFKASAPYKPDLTPEPYLVLTSSMGGSLEAPEQASDGALAIIMPGVIDVAHPVEAKVTRSEFHKIAFRFTRPTGEPYEFNGRDHRLEFDLT